MTFCMDNEALYDITDKAFQKQNATYDDLNASIANVMGGTTTALRFPGQSNSFVPINCFFYFLIAVPEVPFDQGFEEAGDEHVSVPSSSVCR